MKPRPLYWTTALLLLALQGGCAGWFLHGAETHHGVPEAYRAHLRIRQCASMAAIAAPQPADLDYYLAADAQGPVLYELEPRKRSASNTAAARATARTSRPSAGAPAGAAIRNAWSDRLGQHFFAWVTDQAAFEFFFPRDASEPPERLVYAPRTYAVKQVGNTFRPEGRAAFRCTLYVVP